MTTGDGNQLVSFQPEELKFNFELGKQSCCDFKVLNSTENHVAFKVKTTSPKKYSVKPNTGVIQPWDSCIIRVTLQAQQEYPPDMQCKDKFLIQSTVVPPYTDVDELPPNTFAKDSGNEVEERKLKVLYLSLELNQGSDGDEGFKTNGQSAATDATIQRLKEERDAAVQQTRLLQQELDMLRRKRKEGPGFSFWFAVVIGLVGIVVGFILIPSFSSSP